MPYPLPGYTDPEDWLGATHARLQRVEGALRRLDASLSDPTIERPLLGRDALRSRRSTLREEIALSSTTGRSVCASG